MDKPQFLDGMETLAAAYPDYALTEKTLAVYFEDLKHLTAEEWQVALAQHRRTSKYFPKISELLEAGDAGRPAAEDIWGRLLVAAETGVKPPLDGPGETALLAAGGWEMFQITPYSELKFLFKAFKEVYQVAVKQEKLQATLPGPQGQRMVAHVD